MRVGAGRRTPATAGSPAAPRRAGFTLQELVVTLLLMGLVMGAMMAVLVRQQRFYRSTNDMVDARTNVRMAIAMVPADLRSVSSSDVRNGTDIYTATASRFDFRTIVGSSVVCRKASATSIIIPPTDLERGSNLTTWLSPPVPGDSMLIFDDSSAAGDYDDHWKVYKVQTVTPTASGSAFACNTSSGFTTAGDSTAGKRSYEITIPGSVTISKFIQPGAPIRFFRPRRYELYQPTTTSGWYLGIRDCNENNIKKCQDLAPLAGPYSAYSSSNDSSGLSFRYYDNTGAEFVPTATVADRSRIWRVRLTARADTRAPIDVPGRRIETYRDSLALDITLRNH
jgi:hypothetical protein